MIPHRPEIYTRAYENGKRLRGMPEPLEKNLAYIDEDWSWSSTYFQLGISSYIIGFSDGWHGIPPAVTS